MSLGEWMKFCNDFNLTKLIDEHNSSLEERDRIKQRQKKVQFNPLHKIYKNVSLGIKGIDMKDFHNLIISVAKTYPITRGSSGEKIDKFYDKIGISDPNTKKKMHGMKTHFYFALPGPNLCAQKVGKDAEKERNALQK